MQEGAGNVKSVNIQAASLEKKSGLNLKDDGITGVILAGGVSARMGVDKTLLTMGEKTFFEIICQFMQSLFTNVLIAGNRSDLAQDLPCYPDRYPGSALGGLYTGLLEAKTSMIFVASCDMPFPDREIVRRLLIYRSGYDAVVPKTPYGFEPLFALYSKNCLDHMKWMLENKQYRIYDFYPKVLAKYVGVDELPMNWRWALTNINTPKQYQIVKAKYSYEYSNHIICRCG